MNTHKFVRLVINRNKDKNQYDLKGLPEGKDFSKPSNYEYINASMLKINDIGFGCKDAELSEHGKVVKVTQKTENGLANITFEDL